MSHIVNYPLYIEKNNISNWITKIEKLVGKLINECLLRPEHNGSDRQSSFLTAILNEFEFLRQRTMRPE